MSVPFLRSSSLALAATAALAAAERPARACGGCFIKSAATESSVVTDHRMAFSVSTQQTVLWDQIKYSGSPSEFSWILPVKSGAVVRLSHDEWFASLDALTSPTITGPSRNCGASASGGGFGCGSSSANAAGFGDNGTTGVQVISQSVVGPYDTVTLQSSDPTALEAWLTVNGYALPDAFRPTVAAYVAEGFDFIALRLQPGQGVQAMQPVRVVTPGADVSLPLRMVAAGVGASVGITLYVVGEGRYEAKSPFYNAVVDDSQLVWFSAQSRSNYQDLSLQLMKSHNARTWLTEFAAPVSLQNPASGGAYCGSGVGGAPAYCPGQPLASLYLQQCQGKPPVQCVGGNASSDAASGAYADGGCNPDPCASFDDLDVALVGMHPSSTWVTRLRAFLPVDALSEGDLQIQASTPQAIVSSQHSTNVYDDPSYSPCGTKGGCSASAAEARPFGEWLVMGTFAFVGVGLARRRRR